AIIVDEAHQLPELAAAFFGHRVSTRQLQELARDVQAEAQAGAELAALAEQAMQLSGDVARLEQQFAGQPQRQTLQAFLAGTDRERCAAQVGDSLTAIRQMLAPLEERNAETASLLERAVGLLERWSRVLETPTEREVRWTETLQRGGSLNATPIEVAEDFARMRATYPGTWVLT